MEQWPVQFRTSQLAQAERGRPFARLASGILWAIVAIFVISILAFVVGLFLKPTIYLI